MKCEHKTKSMWLDDEGHATDVWCSKCGYPLD